MSNRSPYAFVDSTGTALPRRLRPVHKLPAVYGPDKARSFYNAIWCAARDRYHVGGNLLRVIDERDSSAPRFPEPVVEFYRQWIEPESEIATLQLPTVARIAVDAFYVELAAFHADPDGYRERLRLGATNSTSVPDAPAH